MVADPTTERLLDLIQSEYLEMPGLCLTRPQIQRLWCLDSDTCSEAVETLVTSHFLKRTDHGAYVLASMAS